MADITNPKLIWAKGILFVLLGLLASALQHCRGERHNGA